MRYLKIIVLLLTVPLVALGAKPLDTAELKITEQHYTIQITHFANLYGVDESLVKSVVQCESQGNLKAKGDGGRAFGLMQYHKPTFEEHARRFGEELDYYSSYDQLKVGIWAISQGYGRSWTAYRAIQNGGTYSFYSNLLQKHFTVRCDKI